MLDSERACKIKAKLRWRVFRNFVYVSNYVHLKSFAFKTTNVMNLTEGIQQNSYRVLQVISKTLAQPVYFLKAVECFWKSCKTTHFRKPKEVSQNTSTFMSIGRPITK